MEEENLRKTPDAHGSAVYEGKPKALKMKFSMRA